MPRQPAASERRVHARVPAGVPFLLSADGKEEAFDLVDLSESGARIRTAHAIHPMTRLEVSLTLPGTRVGGAEDVRFRTTGVVVWSHKQPKSAEHDVGLFFSELDDRQRSLLRVFVSTHA